MIARLLYTSVFILLAVASIDAQVEIKPLSGYEALHERETREGFAEKVDCEPIDETAFTLIRPGEELNQLLQPDTFGLNGNITYTCRGCNVATGGTALLRRDTLVYTGREDAEERIDTLVIQGCNGNGECGEELSIIIVVQREGRTINLPAQTIQPGERITVAGPDDAFARKAFCRSLETCAEDYLGRDQRFFFPTSQRDGNDFVYIAAQFGGTDAVCINLCTRFGLCDTYRTEINIVRPSVGLPFLDDFSDGGFRPDATLWQDRDVLINRTFAEQPPTLGVATFDAVGFDGKAYNATGGARPVARDFLTSAALKLNGQNGAALSFYLQPRGLGNRPERQDSFLVQFLHPDGQFRTVLRVGGRPPTEGSSVPLPFEPYLIMLDDDYLYDGFIFRFANKSSERGAVDMWHLDYVKLATEDNDVTTDDLALTRVPGSVLGPYSSMPLRHFQAASENLVMPGMTVGVYNVADRPLRLSGSKESEINVLRADRSPIAIGNLLLDPVAGIPTSFPPGEHVVRSINPTWSGFDAVRQYLNGLPLNEEPVVMTTRFSLTPNGGEESSEPGFSKAGDNNDASSTTILDEYMAYDDGSAEATLELTEGTVVLQRYRSFVADELRGIQVRIPRGLSSFGNQALRLVVYTGSDLPEEQIYSEDFAIVTPEDVISDTLEGFTTYLFDQPLPLPVGEYFVGWEQQRSTVSVGIGYDRNTSPAPGTQYFNFGSGWRELTGTVSGTVMLRPLMMGFEGFTTSIDGADGAPGLVEVFPNPTNGLVQIKPLSIVGGENWSYRLFNAAGAEVRAATGTNQLDLSAQPSGLYLLEVSNGQRRSYHKIIRN